MIINFKFIFLLFIGLFIINEGVADINSVTITADTLTALPNCVHYRVRGLCYWAGVSGISTTPYIEQYLPDVVVTVFNKPGDNPWFEMNHTIDQVGEIAEQQIVSSLTGLAAGQGQQSFSDIHEQNIFFKEADVVGNPALAVLPNTGFLSSTATPLVPYYQSMVDAASWHGLPQAKTPLAEEAYAMVSNLDHHVGTFPIDWGGIYPHEGFVATSNDAKAAAVIAQRATDLITSSNPIIIGHIYKSLSNQCGEECTASPIQENSSKTTYQLIYPIEENHCDYFGKTISYGNDIETQTKSAYVWIVWRYYQGCADGDGQFIGKTIIN